MRADFDNPHHASLLRDMADASRDAVFLLDAAGRIVYGNERGRQLLGRSDRDFLDVALCQVVQELLFSPTAVSRSQEDGADGPPAGKWFVQSFRDATGVVVGGIGIHPGADTTHDVERQLRDAERRFRDFVESASDWFWETDQDLRYSYLSERYQEATGLMPESRLGRRRGDFRLGGPDDGDWPSHLADLQARRPFRDFVFAYLDADQRRRVAKVSGRPVFDDEGGFLGYRGVGRDITREREAEQQIRFLAQHDVLTGLPNRALLKERMAQAVAQSQRSRHPLAVLCVDLDDFKSINDTLGHVAGDVVLREMALRMRETTRAEDMVARWGGDEFTILTLTRRGDSDAEALAERLLQKLAAPIDVAGTRVHCRCSIGISLYPRDGSTADELIHHADLALYKAKASGRNGHCFFVWSMTEEAQQRRVIEDDLRSALDGEALFLNFQPQVELATGRVVGLEALLRWKHPEKGLIPPDVFIPVAERCGLILAIDRWVLRQACLQAKRWVDAGLLTERVAVNLSAMQLSRSELVKDLVAILEQTRLPARHLEIEITESVLLTDTDVVARQLAAVNDLGVWLSVDDFGTGYSSLTYLRRFPAQKVKIDTSFVRDVCTDANDASIACAIISLGHSLGLRVIAEGVETQEQFDYLRQAGCDEVQGYFIARPMGAADCEAFLLEAAQAESTENAVPGTYAVTSRHGCRRAMAR